MGFSDTIKIQLLIYIEQVQCGAKPIAFMGLQTRYIEEATEIIVNKKKLFLYIEDVEGYQE